MLQIENLQRGRPTCPQRNTFSLLIHIGIGHAAALISRYHLSHVPRPMGGQTPALTSACTNPKPEGQSEIIKNEITRPTISSDRAKKKSFGSSRLRAVRGHKSTPIRGTLTGEVQAAPQSISASSLCAYFFQAIFALRTAETPPSFKQIPLSIAGA